MRMLSSLLLFLVLVPIGSVVAQEDEAEPEDHPLISRFEGSTINRYSQRDFDEYMLATGASEDGELSDRRRLEGKVTRLLYRLPEGTSTLEAFRSYEQALSNAGFEILFSCAREECGSGFGSALYLNEVNNILHDLGSSGAYENYFEASFEDRYVGERRYLTGTLERPEGRVVVALYIANPEGPMSESYWDVNNYAVLDVVEVAAREEGTVEVTAEHLAEEIDRTGRVAVDGIYFATNSADLESESDAVLEEIAELLDGDPELSVYVVGHTDNQGAFDANMTLSEQRAAAVVQALVTEHGVARDRLQPVGVGPVAPVASNDTEEGRSQNRRVVLVENS
jgi:outer membrane protein OmpA-like peptidoglycan-associated protein